MFAIVSPTISHSSPWLAVAIQPFLLRELSLSAAQLRPSDFPVTAMGEEEAAVLKPCGVANGNS